MKQVNNDAGLRELRLWHWTRMKTHRAAEKEYRALNSLQSVILSRGYAHSEMVQANFHMKQVQVLNDLFDVGDTAEGDWMKKQSAEGN